MVIFPKEYEVRRFSAPKYERGYEVMSHSQFFMKLDVQTTEDSVISAPEGDKSVQALKVFSDEPFLLADEETKQHADLLFFQNKWFVCRSCRLSENTFLKHYLSTFVECLDKDLEPFENDSEDEEVTEDESE